MFKKIIITDNEEPQFNTVKTIPIQTNTIDTSNLKPVGIKNKPQEEIQLGTLDDILAAEEEYQKSLDKQYREALATGDYEDVVAAMGPTDRFFPCDDQSHQCSMLCSKFQECPYQPKPEKYKVISMGKPEGAESVASEPKKKTKRKKK